MRIHSDVLTAADIHAALKDCQEHNEVAPSVVLAVLSRHGSRTRKNAYEVQLGTDDGTSFTAAGLTSDLYPAKAIKRASKRACRNGYGNHDEELSRAATWHEWGWFLSRLWEIDPNMSTTYYPSRYEFDLITQGWEDNARAIEWRTNWDARAFAFDREE